MLVGKETERVLSCGHTQLSTWGIGKDLNDQQWRAVLRQLIARHVVWVDAERHNVLRLGQLANNLLRGEIKVEVRREVIDQPEGKSNRAQAKASRDEILAGLGGSARQIFEALRKWRLETAHALNKPPYVIFPDRTLLEIARRKPVTLDAMLGIPGVGRRKLESYAEEIIRIVRAEC